MIIDKKEIDQKIKDTEERNAELVESLEKLKKTDKLTEKDREYLIDKVNRSIKTGEDVIKNFKKIGEMIND